MKKGLLIVGLMFCVSLMASAQKNGKTKFSVGAELGFVNGDFRSKWSIGLGANGTLEHFFAEQLSATAQSGINFYLGKKVGGFSGVKYQDLTIVPITLGARYYLGDSFHAGAQTGVGILGGGSSNVGSSGVAFAFSPQVGYSFKTNSGKSVDISAKYDVYIKNGNFTSPSLRLSYIF